MAEGSSAPQAGHNRAVNVEKCESKCKPRAKVMSVRHPLTFYSSAYREYVIGRRETTSFEAYLELVFNESMIGMPYSTLTQRVKRSCGTRCNEFTFIRTETLVQDLSDVLDRHGLLSPAIHMTYIGTGKPITNTSAHKVLAKPGTEYNYTCAQLLRVAALDSWIYQTFNYTDYSDHC